MYSTLTFFVIELLVCFFAGQNTKEPTDPVKVLDKFRSITKTEKTEFITFNRMHRSILQQLMKIYKGAKLSLQKSPDIHFEGEIAADVGGPTREFFHVAMNSLFKVDPLFRFALFTGERGHYVPHCNMDALSSGCFQMVGKLLAHSILHGGFGLPGLAPAVTKYLVCGSLVDAEDLVTVADVADVELREIIERKVKALVCNPLLCIIKGV